MALASESITINGNPTDVYKIVGYGEETLVVLKSDLSKIDIDRLVLATGGTIKKREDAKVGDVTVTGDYLNLHQALFADINRWGSEYFAELLSTEADIIRRVTLASISNNPTKAIYDLTARVAALEAEAPAE